MPLIQHIWLAAVLLCTDLNMEMLFGNFALLYFKASHCYETKLEVLRQNILSKALLLPM